MTERSLRCLGALVPLLLACAGSVGPPLGAGFDIRRGDPSGAPISKDIGLIADSHAHYLWGQPTYIQTNIADQMVSPSAIRTPEGDFWGPTTELWFLDKALPNLPLVHLGDATDIACQDEYTTFLTLMGNHKTTSKQPWFEAPGNHDSYFYGNYYEVGGDWSLACSGKPLTKPTFITWYLSALAGQVGPDGKPDVISEAHAEDLKKPTGDVEVTAPFGSGLLKAVAWETSAEAPWTSYVVQELDLTRPGQSTPVYGILLDTVVYSSPPALVPILGAINAGLTGDISGREAATVRRWAKDARDSSQGRAVLVLMGHHPYGALTDGGKALLNELHEQYGAVLYVSAHDHSGKWDADGSGAKVWPELNIGALVDAPVEARELRLAQRTTSDDKRTADHRVVIRSTVSSLDDFIDGTGADSPHCSQIDAAWDAPPGAEDYYESYRDTGLIAISQTQLKILDVLLASWDRYLGVIDRYLARNQLPWPAGWTPLAVMQDQIKTAHSGGAVQKMGALRDLITETPLPADPELRRLVGTFAVCQGWWGSKYELQKRRIPNPKDRGLVLPKE